MSRINENKKKSMHILILFFGMLFLAFLSLTIGYYKMSFQDTIRALFLLPTQDRQVSNIVYNIRLPRVLATMLVGASLSVSGSAYQGMFKNPLVSPDILGVTSGASVGAAFAILLNQSLIVTQVVAFLFGILATSISYVISQKTRLQKTVSIILSGTVIGSICTSIVSMIKYISDPNDALPEITFWLMGSFSKITMQNVLISLIPITIGFIILFIARWKLNILMLDDDEASSLGIHPTKWNLIIICASTLLTSAAVCLSGIIGWIGLMIPHIARFIFGSNYRHVIPSSFVLGSVFLLIIDTLIRSVFSTEVPIGIFTSILGGIFFLMLIIKKPTSRVKGTSQ